MHGEGDQHADRACDEAQQHQFTHVDAHQRALTGTEAAHHRGAGKMPLAVAARGHGHGDGGEHHRHQRGETEEAASAIQRGSHLRTCVLDRLQSLPACECGACGGGETFDRSGITGDDQAIAEAAAFLQQPRGGQVGEIEESLGRHVEIIERGVGFLRHQGDKT